MSKKKTANPTKIYWDTCLFLSMIDEGNDYFKERFPILDSLFHDAVNKRIEIHTSTFTIAEVAFFEKEREGLDDDSWGKINSLWHPKASPVLLSGVSPVVTVKARELIREVVQINSKKKESQRTSLKPADSLHLATFKQLQADVFFTYDERLLNLSKELGFNAKEPENDQIQFPESNTNEPKQEN